MSESQYGMRWLTWTLACLLLVLLYYLVAGRGGLLDMWHQAGEYQRLKQENAELLERNRLLASDLQDLREGLAGIEGLAREKLGMIREDEEFYQLIDPGSVTEEEPAPSDGP